MPIIVDWDNDEKTIIHQKYDAEWTSEDFQQAIDKTYAMIEHEASGQIVNIIADMSGSRTPDYKILSFVSYYQDHKHLRQGKYIVVGNSRALLSILQVITHIADRIIPETVQVQFVMSLAEARVKLAESPTGN